MLSALAAAAAVVACSLWLQRSRRLAADARLIAWVTLAGFGFRGTFHTGMAESDGKRRAGSNKISGLERSVLVCDPSTENKTALEFLITPGDSGGGLFIGNKLAGVHSFLMAKDGKPNGTYTDESAHTRVSLYVDWVESEIKKYEKTLADSVKK
jgi:hypothetical protein